MSQDEQATPTPRTDSTIGADKFVPAWKVRKDMGQLERELSAAKVEAFELSLNPDIAEYAALRAEAERLREALEQAHDAMEAFTDPEGNMPADTGEFRELKAAMLSIRPLLGVPK